MQGGLDRPGVLIGTLLLLFQLPKTMGTYFFNSGNFQRNLKNTTNYDSAVPIVYDNTLEQIGDKNKNFNIQFFDIF